MHKKNHRPFPLFHGALLWVVLAALSACGPGAPSQTPDVSPLVDVQAEIEVLSQVALNDEIEFNGSGSQGPGLSYSWSVIGPQGCSQSGAFIGESQSEVVRYQPSCVGEHEVTLRVSTLEGESDQVTAKFEVTLDETLLSIEAEVVEEAFPNEAQIILEGDVSTVASGLNLEIEVSPISPNDLVPAFRFDEESGVVFIEMAQAHGEYEVSLRWVGENIAGPRFERVLVALNNAPEITAFTADDFVADTPVELRAEVEDVDSDVVTCSLAFADNNEGPLFELPEEPSSEDPCAFSFTPPAGLNAWHIELLASDGFGGEDRAAVVVQAGNEAPQISNVEWSGEAVNYACDVSCASENVTLSFDVSDDFDAASALLVELVDTSAEASLGSVALVDTRVVDERVFLDLAVTRDDVGVLSGDYSFSVLVKDATFALVPNEVLVSQSDFVLSVVNRAPTFVSSALDDAPHHYDSRYRAEIEGEVIVTDLEENGVDIAVSLLECPQDCASLNVEDRGNQGTISLLVDAANIQDVVGDYTVLIIATDAEGEQTRAESVFSVLNRAPILSPQFESTIDQAYTAPAGHRAGVQVFVDPDGDPLDVSAMAVRCPENNASCSDLSVSLAGGEFSVRTEVAQQKFLGNYVLSGIVSDGDAEVSRSDTVNVRNFPATLATLHSQRQISHHQTSANEIVTNESPFEFHINTTDRNGDPRQIVLVESLRGEVLFTSPSVSGLQDAEIQTPFNFRTTYAELQNNRAGFFVRIRIEDAFGQGVENVQQIEFDNRAPTGSVNVRIDGHDGVNTQANGMRFLVNGSLVRPERLSGNRLGFFNPPAPLTCFIPGTCGPSVNVYVDQNINDPDGDPLEQNYDYQCLSHDPSEAEDINFSRSEGPRSYSSSTTGRGFLPAEGCGVFNIDTGYYFTVNSDLNFRTLDCGVRTGIVSDGLGGNFTVSQQNRQTTTTAVLSPTTCF